MIDTKLDSRTYKFSVEITNEMLFNMKYYSGVKDILHSNILTLDRKHL